MVEAVRAVPAAVEPLAGLKGHMPMPAVEFAQRSAVNADDEETEELAQGHAAAMVEILRPVSKVATPPNLSFPSPERLLLIYLTTSTE